MGHEREGGSICDSDCDRREKKRTRDRGDDTDVAIPSSKVMKISLILYTLKVTSRFINAISTGRRMIARAEQSRSESVSEVSLDRKIRRYTIPPFNQDSRSLDYPYVNQTTEQLALEPR